MSQRMLVMLAVGVLLVSSVAAFELPLGARQYKQAHGRGEVVTRGLTYRDALVALGAEAALDGFLGGALSIATGGISDIVLNANTAHGVVDSLHNSTFDLNAATKPPPGLQPAGRHRESQSTGRKRAASDG